MAQEANNTAVKDTPKTDAKEAAKPAKTKKKSKRSVPAGHVHIQATFNNTIITVTDKQGNVISTASAGSSGFRGSKKGTAYAAQIASEKALTAAKQNNNLSRVDVFVKGVGLGRDAAIRALLSVDVQVDSIKEVTGIAHGGTRPRKAKSG